jgi:threonine/homoserine/homoserine lactone efflux protein
MPFTADLAIPNPLIVPVGVLVGLAVSAPVGPVNVLCIQRALQRGVAGGIAAGLGAVLGDGLIALAAAMGIGAITTMVNHYRFVIQGVGGLVLVAFGIVLCRGRQQIATTREDASPAGVLDYASDVPKAFFMTVTNPGAVLGLFAIFGGIGSFVEVRGPVGALMLVASIIAGSLIWWTMLSVLVAHISDRFDVLNIGRINLIAGLALIGFGLVLLGEIVIVVARSAAG